MNSGGKMTRVIASATNKGGEGKTELSIIFSEFLSQVKQESTLGGDLDPQANYSGYFLDLEYDQAHKDGKIPPIHPDYDPIEDDDWDGRSSIANVFYGEELIPYPTAIKNLDLLPAHSYKLQEAEHVKKNDLLEKVHMQLLRFVKLPEVQQTYKNIVLDTPPSKGPLTISGIKACTHLIIPSQMESDSLEGIYGMLQLWKQETYSRSSDYPINLVAIVPNRVRDVNLHTQYLEQLRTMESTKDYVLDSIIKERVIYGELRVKADQPKSVFSLPDSHPAKKECMAICESIYKRMNKNG